MPARGITGIQYKGQRGFIVQLLLLNKRMQHGMAQFAIRGIERLP
jgi:hypothetical protein